MNYSISSDNLHIIDSYIYTLREMPLHLLALKARHPKSHVWNRSFRSLTAEWAVHNALYRLGFMRSRTRDVDLNVPNYFEWVYILLAPMARMVIR